MKDPNNLRQDMYLADPEATDEEDYVNDNEIDKVFVYRMRVFLKDQDMFPVDCQNGQILSENEKKFWRHTYNNMKRKTKKEWEVAEWLDKQFLCYHRLEIAAKRANLTV